MDYGNGPLRFHHSSRVGAARIDYSSRRPGRPLILPKPFLAPLAVHDSTPHAHRVLARITKEGKCQCRSSKGAPRSSFCRTVKRLECRAHDERRVCVLA